MKETLHTYLDGLLATTGVVQNFRPWLLLLFVIAIGVALDYLIRFLLLYVVRGVVRHTKNKWDDMLLDDRVLRRFCHIVPIVLVAAMLPVIFEGESSWLTITTRLLSALIVAMVLRFTNAVLDAVFRLLGTLRAWRGKPLGGLLQTGKIILFLIALVLIVSILFHRSPAVFLTGLGASAAIVMLIFRDSILGFVSGIQLSANNMLSVGDWITIPKYGADGEVEEVNLTTVKVRNFDNTITTIPPYLLVSESFQNWQGMIKSGGRRVKRSINIDMTSIRFCSCEMLERFARIDLLHDYITDTQEEIEAFNSKRGLDPDEGTINGRNQTNIGVFRNYLTLYLRHHAEVNRNMTLIVRQLQPTETGIPLELYFFADTVDWVPYERIQSDIFDHVLAILPEFDLRVFQTPTGNDLRSLQP